MGVQKHKTKEEARDYHQEVFDDVAKGSSWMAAVWQVKDGKIELVKVTTNEFPVGDMLIAVGQLATRLHESRQEEAKSKPIRRVFPLQWTPDNIEETARAEKIMNGQSNDPDAEYVGDPIKAIGEPKQVHQEMSNYPALKEARIDLSTMPHLFRPADESEGDESHD